jgi:hypothetical protein
MSEREWRVAACHFAFSGVLLIAGNRVSLSLRGILALATVGLPQAWDTQTSSFEAFASSLSNIAEWFDRGLKYMLLGT